MQVVDFFSSQWYSETTNARDFYIYDPGNAARAQITVDDALKPVSVNVENASEKVVVFQPIDHNLDIRKEGSTDLDSTCDYMLMVGGREQIIFGEIKTGRKAWARSGMLQVLHTLDIFRANHDLAEWGTCRGYVSNFHRPHTSTSTKTLREEFKALSGGIRLYVKNEVKIDGEES